jgi:hypothetical protein
MNRSFDNSLLTLATFALALTSGASNSIAATKHDTAPPPWGTHLVITNDDVPSGNTATFYAINSKGGLRKKRDVSTGGTGLGGGYFGTGRVNVIHSKSQHCAYVSDATSNDVAGIDVLKLKLTGTFKASSGDSGAVDGIGLAITGQHLYAGFTGSNTIATYKVLSGCKLEFENDISASGLNGGAIDGMAANGKILVVAYDDGSIESFNIAKGSPVSNGDEQLSTGSSAGNYPGGVDISQDGHFAIFGDTSATAVVEISDISSGKLTSTVAYTVGTGNSNNVRLSPDESLIYIANNSSGQVSAAFFNAVTGGVITGCTSNVLLNFNSTWFYTSGLVSELNTGTGNVLYVAEWGQPSSIGILNVSKGTAPAPTCTLTETSFSPAADPNSQGLLSIGAYPPRTF